MTRAEEDAWNNLIDDCMDYCDYDLSYLRTDYTGPRPKASMKPVTLGPAPKYYK